VIRSIVLPQTLTLRKGDGQMRIFPGMEWLPNALETLIEPNYPHIRVIAGSSTDPEITADGKRVLLFCSPNYLGLSNHPEVCRVSKDVLDQYGAGTNGSGIVSGYTELHQQLEERLADYLHVESVKCTPLSRQLSA